MSNESTTLIHFGDLHVWNVGLDHDFTFKRLLGLTNLILRRHRKFPPVLAEMLVRRLRGEEADYVLFTGDLTTTALRQEFTRGRQLLRPILERWDGRFIAIPGNHDRYTHRAVNARLFENLFHNPPADLPCAIDLDAVWTVILMDYAVPRRLSSRGHASNEQIQRLEALLKAERRRGRNLLVAGHYPLIYPPHHKPGWEHVLPQRDAVLGLLHDYGVRIYLHGHAHQRWRLEENGLTHLNCGSSTSNGRVPAGRPGYLKITLAAGGIHAVEMHWLSPISHKSHPDLAESAWNCDKL